LFSIQRYEDPVIFLEETADLLYRAEILHNLCIGVLNNFIQDRSLFPQFIFLALQKNDQHDQNNTDAHTSRKKRFS